MPILKLFGIDASKLRDIAYSKRAERTINSHRNRNGRDIGQGNYIETVTEQRNIRAESIYRTLTSYLSENSIDTSRDPSIFAGSLVARAIRFENQTAALTRRLNNQDVPVNILFEADATDVETLHADSKFIVGYVVSVEDIRSRISYPTINPSSYDLSLPEAVDEYVDIINELIYRVQYGVKDAGRIYARRLFKLLTELNGESMVFPTLPKLVLPGFDPYQFRIKQRELVTNYLTHGSGQIDFEQFVNGLFHESFGVDVERTHIQYTEFKVVTPTNIISEITDGLIDNRNCVIFEV